MRKVAVLVLHWKGYEDTEKCVVSLNKSSGDFTVFLIDNGSHDTRLCSLADKYPNVVVIKNPRNLGFAEGNNRAIKQALAEGYDYITLLNNDTFVEKDWLLRLRSCQKEKTEIVSPRIYDLSDKLWFGSGKVIKPFFRPIHRSAHDKSPDFLSGCCFLAHRFVFENCGFFDPSYFLYYEDVDFFTRAKNSGFTLKVCPDSNIYHKASSSLTEPSAEKVYYTVRNNLFFIKKYASMVSKIFAYPYVILLSAKIVLSRFDKNYTKSVFLAWSDFELGIIGRRP